VIGLVHLAMVLTLCDPSLPQSHPLYCEPEFHKSEAVGRPTPAPKTETPPSAVEEPPAVEPEQTPEKMHDHKRGRERHDHRHHKRDW
jgi:hypothetical protein